jgi:hypothetical protein
MKCCRVATLAYSNCILTSVRWRIPMAFSLLFVRFSPVCFDLLLSHPLAHRLLYVLKSSTGARSARGDSGYISCQAKGNEATK